MAETLLAQGVTLHTLEDLLGRPRNLEADRTLQHLGRGGHFRTGRLHTGIIKCGIGCRGGGGGLVLVVGLDLAGRLSAAVAAGGPALALVDTRREGMSRSRGTNSGKYLMRF